ncbi:MAG: hypothetical protein QOJ85_1966 [Solirubrobacteraceae bacterium]|nr:hypothetical protein [Solirubrobacteraceae bacterium]
MNVFLQRVHRVRRQTPGSFVSMGRESAGYFLQLPRELDDAVVLGLREGGAESGHSDHTWIGLRVRDPHRYWIDLRLRRGPESLLEIRIALTNDEWSIRGGLRPPPRRVRRPRRRLHGSDLRRPCLHVRPPDALEHDNDAELEWKYEREINKIEQMWDPPDASAPE